MPTDRAADERHKITLVQYETSTGVSRSYNRDLPGLYVRTFSRSSGTDPCTLDKKCPAAGALCLATVHQSKKQHPTRSTESVQQQIGTFVEVPNTIQLNTATTGSLAKKETCPGPQEESCHQRTFVETFCHKPALPR